MLNFFVCICEDQPGHVAILQNIINAWGKKRGIEIVYKCFDNPFNFEAQDILHCDLVCMDIELGEIDGLKLAKEIRKLDEDIPLIFVTAHENYSYSSQGMFATDFLKKPIDVERCERALDRAMRKYAYRHHEGITIGKTKIYPRELVNLEANDHATTLHKLLSNDKVSKPLADVMSLLPEEQFCQIHRAYAVNLLYVNRYSSDDVTLENGSRIPMTRNWLDSFKETYLNYNRGMR